MLLVFQILTKSFFDYPFYDGVVAICMDEILLVEEQKFVSCSKKSDNEEAPPTLLIGNGIAKVEVVYNLPCRICFWRIVLNSAFWIKCGKTVCCGRRNRLFWVPVPLVRDSQKHLAP